ncbi:unnamed protein product [Ectocarpus sp. CCAP 1310/34]|nr:unnamed protein product [Ectocarpus sp. CCAP 1310/34]
MARKQVESLEAYTEQWKAPPAIPEFKLPGPNPFIPEDVRVIVPDGKLPKPGEAIDPPTVVENLSNDGVWKVRHKLDDIFAQPKARCKFQLVSPAAFESPRTWAALDLFGSCLNEHLTEYTYDALVSRFITSLALVGRYITGCREKLICVHKRNSYVGLSFNLSVNSRGIGLSFRGYGNKMPEFIDKVAEAVATYTPSDPVEFERLRDVVSSVRYTVREIGATLDSIELADLRPLASRVLAEAEGVCLMQGNLKEEDVPRYMEGVRRWLNPTPLPEDKRPETKVVRLPQTPKGYGSLLRRPEEDESNENSAVQLLFQVSDRSLESQVLAEVLMATIEEPFYNSLRTKQQLGYTVFSGVSRVEGVRFMYLTVQSAERSAPYLTDRCLEFVQEFRQQLVDLTPGKLSDFVQGLVSRKLEPDHRLSSEVNRNWGEIVTGQLNFDRRREEVEALKKVQEKDLLRFFDSNEDFFANHVSHLKEGGEDRRLLTSEVFAKKYESDMELPAAEAMLVPNAKEWRGAQEKFPIRIRLA